MKIEMINHSKQRIISSQFLKKWLREAGKELRKRNISSSQLNKKIVLAFLTEDEMRELNGRFRKKKQATDVLSFLENHPDQLGELALCPKYIKEKARKNSMGVREYSAYIILHGLLHLLGFEHEKSKKSAQKMFQLQDQVFEKLSSFFFYKKKKQKNYKSFLHS